MEFYSDEYELARYFVSNYQASDLSQSELIKLSEKLLEEVSPGNIRLARLRMEIHKDNKYTVVAQLNDNPSELSVTKVVISASLDSITANMTFRF